ncbi:MAG: hypothetical protein RIR10_485 [Planctomycetota bacterium]|jgi:hypothetical protein
MSLTKTVGFFAGTTLAIGGAAFGADQNSELAAEVANLKAQIAEMKNSQGDAWLTEQRASEIRGIVTDVLADADTRSSLQGSGAGAGYNGGFFMSSADGNYSMKLNVLEQVRWTFNNRNDAGTGEDQTWGFENKRTRLTFGGNMVDSTWSYKVAYYFAYTNDVEFDADGAVLADAFVSKDMGGGLSMTVGQFKLPFSGEYGTDAGNLQFNDYSTISNAFADGYGQGLMLSYSADAFRAAVAYVNALSQVDADWGAGSPSDEFAFTGRAEFKLSGTWDQFNNAMSFRGEEMGVLIGVGANWADSNTAGDGDVFGATADVTVDFGGANVMGAFYWDNNDDSVSENPYGFTLQGGVFVSDDVELVARYEYGDLDTNLDSNDFSTLTFGANWYMAQNTAKLGFNFGYAFDGIGIWEFPASGNNWLADGAGEDGQWMLQAQMSFSF